MNSNLDICHYFNFFNLTESLGVFAHFSYNSSLMTIYLYNIIKAVQSYLLMSQVWTLFRYGFVNVPLGSRPMTDSVAAGCTSLHIF